jgi:hypothetical protein
MISLRGIEVETRCQQALNANCSPMPDRWGTAGVPSNRMRAAMSGALYLGDGDTGDLRREDVIGRKLG